MHQATVKSLQWSSSSESTGVRHMECQLPKHRSTSVSADNCLRWVDMSQPCLPTTQHTTPSHNMHIWPPEIRRKHYNTVTLVSLDVTHVQWTMNVWLIILVCNCVCVSQWLVTQFSLVNQVTQWGSVVAPTIFIWGGHIAQRIWARKWCSRAKPL